MSRFSIKNPYLIVVLCLMVLVVGVVSLARMPIDLFPAINLPEVVVATFYNGMAPEDIETEITSRFERYFTLGSGIDHTESRSLPGVSIIKIYFQPTTNADADVTEISNLAMADLRRFPPGTLPPVVMKFDASSQPVTLVTLAGKGLNQTQLHDIGQFAVRNQLSTVAGASVPPPFGGQYRQIMVYVDPLKLASYQLSPMDVVREINNANLILPAGDAKIGPFDYNIYTNSQIGTMPAIDAVPLKTVGTRLVTIGDVGQTVDGHSIQTNVVRVNGQNSVYLPVMKQGGDTNTIAVVDGIKQMLGHLIGIPKNLELHAVFDQSLFVKQAISTLLHEGLMGLVLTGLMILLFLGSGRATIAVFLSIPLSALAAFILLGAGGSSINVMILSGLALVFSRLIDNSVIVLENIFRHLEMGEAALLASQTGGDEVGLAVLAATLTTAVVFFPVIFLYGVSRYLFSALALAVVLALFASFFVAMTVVPLFCARFIHNVHGHSEGHEAEHGARPAQGRGARFNAAFNRRFDRILAGYEATVQRALRAPRAVTLALLAVFAASLALYPLLGLAFFPRTDAGQFMINLSAPSGTRIEDTTALVKQVENIIHEQVPPSDLDMIVSNIGVAPGYSSIYTSNSGPDTATVQVALKDGHRIGSYDYMDRIRAALQRRLPQLQAFFQTGGLQDAVLNQGQPAPIDVQVSGSNLDAIHAEAAALAARIRVLPGVNDAYVPQNVDYPSLKLNIDRERAAELGLSQREAVDNVITALTSNGMIAPSYWIDPRSGQDYMLTVQYPESTVKSLGDLGEIPLHAPNHPQPFRLDAVGSFTHLSAPTEVDHYQIQRDNDVYVTTKGEDLGRVGSAIDRLLAQLPPPAGIRVNVRGLIAAMRSSFSSFSFGLLLALGLLYLVLVAQFKSFLDPLLILLAVPMGVIGVMLALLLTGTTLNIQSLMGIVMMVGIVTSNSILIVEFAHRLEREHGLALREAIVRSCRLRLRPILMTSLATVIGLIPMALKLGEGSEAYAPLAWAIIGGLTVSVALTIFIVPAAYVWAYETKS